jgi:hypothetical protein
VPASCTRASDDGREEAPAKNKKQETKVLSRMVPGGELLDGVHLRVQVTVLRRDTGCSKGSMYLVAPIRPVHQCELTQIRCSDGSEEAPLFFSD